MISYDRAAAVFRYEPDTGILYWLVKMHGRTRNAGDPAGWRVPSGHIRVCIDRQRAMVHQIIWLLVTGEWPQDEIDHRDGDPANNRFSNLRVVGRAGNAKNRKKNANNTSGYKGVSRWKDKWKAEIMADGRSRYLGLYETAESANQAYLAASRNLHGEFARGA